MEQNQDGCSSKKVI